MPSHTHNRRSIIMGCCLVGAMLLGWGYFVNGWAGVGIAIGGTIAVGIVFIGVQLILDGLGL